MSADAASRKVVPMLTEKLAEAFRAQNEAFRMTEVPFYPSTLEPPGTDEAGRLFLADRAASMGAIREADEFLRAMGYRRR